MPSREVEICKRLREFRNSTCLSRVAFAREAGLDSVRVSSYEHARAPIRYRDAFKIVTSFPLSSEWLATGKGPMYSMAISTTHYETRAGANALFSEVYDKFLSQDKGAETSAFENVIDPKQEAEIFSRGRIQAEMAVSKILPQWFDSVADDKLNDFVNGLYKFATEFINKKPVESSKAIEKRRRAMEAIRARIRAMANRAKVE